MNDFKSKSEFMKAVFGQKNEASMCPTCLKREKCNIKEEVSLEELMASRGSQRHIRVTIQCRSYVKGRDIPPQEFFDRFPKAKRGGKQ